MNDCYFEKKDWRLCKNEVNSQSYSSRRFSSKSQRKTPGEEIADRRTSEDGAIPPMLETERKRHEDTIQGGVTS